MAKTRLDAIAAVLAKTSGRSTDSVLLEMKSTLIPRMKDPSKLHEEISEAEYQRLLAIGAQERDGILKWMLAGSAKGPFPFPNN